jgi:hypothetical protein
MTSAIYLATNTTTPSDRCSIKRTVGDIEIRFDLHPRRGAGDLQFGMSQAEVRGIVKQPFEFFRRGGVEPTDVFESAGLFAIYDDQDRLEALEFATPAAPTLDGIDLLAVPFTRAKQLLRLRGGPIEEDGEGAQSDRLGIGLWAPNFDEDPSARCEAVSIFRPAATTGIPTADTP